MTDENPKVIDVTGRLTTPWTRTPWPEQVNTCLANNAASITALWSVIQSQQNLIDAMHRRLELQRQALDIVMFAAATAMFIAFAGLILK